MKKAGQKGKRHSVVDVSGSESPKLYEPGMLGTGIK